MLGWFKLRPRTYEQELDEQQRRLEKRYGYRVSAGEAAWNAVLAAGGSTDEAGRAWTDAWLKAIH